VREHLPRGEPRPNLQSGPDLPLELSMWRTHVVSLGGARGRLGPGSYIGPNVLPWSAPGNFALSWYQGYPSTRVPIVAPGPTAGDAGTCRWGQRPT
jgi:hypothetical protein